ncbi:MAG: methylaspartate mutase subunit E [Deltaproteobacteria bacterium]|nr:methylaspartate mutase subunit E [Deltaproteobacteria bacterium]
MIDIRNKKIEEDVFFQEREQVLSEWPTGKEVDLDEAITFHKNLPPHKVWAKKMLDPRNRSETFAITGMGKTTLEQQIELLRYVQDEGQAELLATSVDSFTRVHKYDVVEKGLRESMETGQSRLNGLPVVHHGVNGIRKIIESVDLPVGTRYGAADPRLIDEISLAGGHTGCSGDGLYNFWNMNSKLPPETVLRNHQYVHRLIGYYEEHGVPITPACQGMYGGGIPSSLVMTALLTQMLMMAEQGVKHVMLHFTAQGNLAQDVGSARTLQKLSREYLDRFGHKDVVTILTTGLSLVGYPVELGSAFAAIAFNSIVAKLCGAQINDIRTVSEAMTIPTKEDIAITFRSAKVIVDFFKGQAIQVDPKNLEIESQMSEMETRMILDRVIELGDGDVAVGLIQAIQSGILDHPFATSPLVPCHVMGIKDKHGAVRYLNHGNLPFTKEILAFHKEKITEREKDLGKKMDYETVVNDLLAISRGVLV